MTIALRASDRPPEARNRYLRAFRSPDYHAPNCICRRAGFPLRAGYDLEFPPGHIMRCNDWRYDLG